MPNFFDVVRDLVHKVTWPTEDERNAALEAVTAHETGGMTEDDGPPTEEVPPVTSDGGNS